MPVYLKEEDIVQLLDMPSAIDAVEGVMRQCAVGEAENIARRRARTSAGLFHLMGGASSASGAHALKAYTSTPSGTRFYILLFAADGSLDAILEADHLGRIRTGAASGLATRLFSPQDATTLLVVGCGKQARAQVQAVASVRSLQKILVYSPTPEHRDTFARDLAEKLGLPAASVDNLPEACAAADIITTITNSKTPVLEACWVNGNVHINACGSNSLARQEIPGPLFTRASLVVVDNQEQARTECGDLVKAVFEDYINWEDTYEIQAAFTARIPERPDGISIFESQGLGLWDLACARLVLSRARAAGLGVELPLG